MRSEPRLMCPMCGETGYPRWYLTLHLVNAHGAPWDGAQAMTLSTLRFARRLLLSVTGAQPKSSPVRTPAHRYGHTSPAVFAAILDRNVMWTRETLAQTIERMESAVRKGTMSREAADEGEALIRECIDELAEREEPDGENGGCNV